jgi:hypothetical protein
MMVASTVIMELLSIAAADDENCWLFWLFSFILEDLSFSKIWSVKAKKRTKNEKQIEFSRVESVYDRYVLQSLLGWNGTLLFIEVTS